MNFDFAKLSTRRCGLPVALLSDVMIGADVAARLAETEARHAQAKTKIKNEYERRRRCVAVKPDGKPCKAWAVWNAAEQCCISHLSEPERDRLNAEGITPPRKTPRPTCDCEAYPFPHRPGTGHCLAGDEPLRVHPYEAGQRAPGKKRQRDERNAWRRINAKLMG